MRERLRSACRSTGRPTNTVPARAIDRLIPELAQAETLPGLPPVVDVLRRPPPNPPEAVQTAFVGSSYMDAYTEAATFVHVADTWLERHRGRRLADARLVLDFGSGWGRISRLLLAHVPPRALYALDVDIEMTALVGSTLPGVNALTVAPLPPTVLRNGIADAVLGFSVFSHLSPGAHAAWAAEFGRLSAPGAMAVVTLLDEGFFHQVESAKKAVARGRDDGFTTALADCLPDLSDARARYKAGEPVFAAVGGGGPRAAEFYGWAVVPPGFVRKAWAHGGFEVVEWVRSGVLFPQVMLGLVRR